MRMTVKEFEEIAGRTMEGFKKAAGEMVLEEDFDTTKLELMKDAFRMCELALKLVSQQARTIDEINGKMDKLLKSKGEES